MALQELQSIEEISDIFEVFIFDIWGTIYDGQALFPGVKTYYEVSVKKVNA